MKAKKIINNITVLLFISALLPVLSACWDRPLFTELATNRLEVRLKGTYASNDDRAWLAPQNSAVNDDSVDDYPGGVSTDTADLPGTFMIDIAEMRLSGGGKGDSKFSIDRQTYTVGINDTDAFFKDGIVLENDDPEPDRTYTHLKIYVRKMIFDGARKYELTSAGWAEGDVPQVLFREEETYGFDFNQLQTNYFYDTYRLESDDTNRIFPLTIPIEGGLTFDNDVDRTVLEVRFVVKNFIKKYEYDRLDYTADDPYVLHFYGLSDWLRDVKAGDLQSGSAALGGNILAVARAYVPGNVGNVGGNSGGAGYIIAVPVTINKTESVYRTSGQLRDDSVGSCDAPKAPSGAGSFSALLDYYLKYEQYKSDMNNFISSCVDQSTFENAWTAYETAAENFYIPPIATYTSGASYSISNIPPGDYLFFRANAPAYGQLFEAAFTPYAGNPVIIVAGDNPDVDF